VRLTFSVHVRALSELSPANTRSQKCGRPTTCTSLDGSRTGSCPLLSCIATVCGQRKAEANVGEPAFGRTWVESWIRIAEQRYNHVPVPPPQTRVFNVLAPASTPSPTPPMPHYVIHFFPLEETSFAGDTIFAMSLSCPSSAYSPLCIQNSSREDMMSPSTEAPKNTMCLRRGGSSILSLNFPDFKRSLSPPQISCTRSDGR
jgi:hypothetical protein